MDDEAVRGAEDDAIRAVVKRLARPHPSGGEVIERSAIIAEGSASAAIIEWITAHQGTPEAAAAPDPRRGLHSPRLSERGGPTHAPARYVLPAGAFA
jgi:hypothetical protein